MTSDDKTKQGLHDSSTSPGDLPGQRPASLDRLDVLIGQWEMEASFGAGAFGPGNPAVTDRSGRATFAWLEGRYFLTQRWTVDNPAAPDGIAIIGAGPAPETFSQPYYDSRGVSRVYTMSLDGGVLKIWRDAPGFWQRYTGVISGDGATIEGAWEGSLDGREWKHDFGLTYHRTAHAAHG
jgi:hypothetical protein